MSDRIERPDEDWRRQLTPDQYYVLREHGTEPAFTGRYVHTKADGTYCCAACGTELFSSETKYDSGTGWPSFFQPIDSGHVELHEDRSFSMTRTEVRCSRCGSHLGHVFNDGPAPTGERWCINSAALDLRAEAEDPASS